MLARRVPWRVRAGYRRGSGLWSPGLAGSARAGCRTGPARGLRAGRSGGGDRQGRPGIAEDLAEEMRSNLEIETESNIERGMSPEQARAAARSHFGNST